MQSCRCRCRPTSTSPKTIRVKFSERISTASTRVNTAKFGVCQRSRPAYEPQWRYCIQQAWRSLETVLLNLYGRQAKHADNNTVSIRIVLKNRQESTSSALFNLPEDF